MEKGRFVKIKRINSYLKLEISQGNIYIPTEHPILNEVYDYYSLKDEDDCITEKEEYGVSDYINSLCFEILRSYGLEYDEERNIFKRVVYTWDQNLIPGEKFIGIKVEKIEGTEESLRDLFPGITMNIDILDSFRFNWQGYHGIHGAYRLYLPYTEDNLEIYMEYLEYKISKQFPGNLERKIKKSDLLV